LEPKQELKPPSHVNHKSTAVSKQDEEEMKDKVNEIYD
jgi:hypothetical protein